MVGHRHYYILWNKCKLKTQDLNFLLVSITGLLLGSSGVFNSSSQVHSSQSVLQHFCFGLRSTLIIKITISIRNTRTRIRPYHSFCKSADNKFCDFRIVNELNWILWIMNYIQQAHQAYIRYKMHLPAKPAEPVKKFLGY